VLTPATSTPRVSIWEWAQTALLAANLAWSTLGRGGFPPPIMQVTAALTAALLVVHLLARVVPGGGDSPRRAAHPAGWFFLPFLLYAAVNALWISPVPWLAWRDWFGWAQMIAVFWVVLNSIRSPAPQRVLFLTIISLGIVGVLLACYQCFVNADWQMLGGTRLYYRGRGSGPFGMPNSLAAFFLLVLPAAAALGFRRSATPAARVWWGWVTLVLALGLVLTISRGAWLAFALALMVWPLCAVHGPWLRRMGIAALVLGGLLLAGGVLYSRSPGVRARLAGLITDAGERTRPIAWRGAWALFREHPVIGTGAGSYDVLFEKYRPEGFADRPLYAHNDYLNTCGLPAVFRRGRDRRRALRLGAARGKSAPHRLAQLAHGGGGAGRGVTRVCAAARGGVSLQDSRACAHVCDHRGVRREPAMACRGGVAAAIFAPCGRDPGGGVRGRVPRVFPAEIPRGEFARAGARRDRRAGPRTRGCGALSQPARIRTRCACACDSSRPCEWPGLGRPCVRDGVVVAG
jgi:O-antigen ligase